MVDSVLVSLRNGKESAVMTVPVFSDDFNSTVGFLEDQGRVRGKDVQEENRARMARRPRKKSPGPGAT